jgi:hypothetical protein
MSSLSATAAEISHQSDPSSSNPSVPNSVKQDTVAAQKRLVETEIKDQRIAFNVLVGFIGVAQKRGAFAIDESAKIFECIKMFQ